jgi:hypothetical protein
MRKNGHPPAGGGIQNAFGTQRVPDLEDQAERLFHAYLETFEQAPESDFLLKRYFFEMYFEKEYLQNNIFFIPRADFLWFFKYRKEDEQVAERTIELKKRSAERAEKAIEIATILIRTHYTYEQGASDIIYTRTFADREGEEFIMQNTNDAVAHVEKLLDDFRNDRVTQQPY